MAGVRKVVAEKAGVPPGNVMVAVSHNHSGPDFEKQTDWAEAMLAKVAGAVEEAAKDMEPVSVGYGEDAIGFSINRRKVGSSGESARRRKSRRSHSLTATRPERTWSHGSPGSSA